MKKKTNQQEPLPDDNDKKVPEMIPPKVDREALELSKKEKKRLLKKREIVTK
jgi:hypothetical protein